MGVIIRINRFVQQVSHKTMKQISFVMPKMGESITEATIIEWHKSVGDIVEEDETILEIATDKVDSEIPSPFKGKIVALLHDKDSVVPVGAPIAIIEVSDDQAQQVPPITNPSQVSEPAQPAPKPKTQASNRTKQMASSAMITQPTKTSPIATEQALRPSNQTDRFYSPLIRNIAAQEEVSMAELELIPGTGADNRLTKKDLLQYIQSKNTVLDTNQLHYQTTAKAPLKDRPLPSFSGDVEIHEMDRTRKLIAAHMVRSKHEAPHVTSFLEIDITDIVAWREMIKQSFFKKNGQKLTYTPVFIHAVANALKDFPRINASLYGDKIVIKKYINIGMATATPSDHLIVPVIKNVDQLNFKEIVSGVNDLANRARQDQLVPDEIYDGTFTVTNVGSFGNTCGTPIINQPQVAILSTGAIRKKPAVLTIDGKDEIVVRQFMFLSLSYDHRIVDGALGGRFLRRVGDYLEQFVAPAI